MNKVMLAKDAWLPLLLVLLAATLVGTVIVTVWPPFT